MLIVLFYNFLDFYKLATPKLIQWMVGKHQELEGPIIIVIPYFRRIKINKKSKGGIILLIQYLNGQKIIYPLYLKCQKIAHTGAFVRHFVRTDKNSISSINKFMHTKSCFQISNYTHPH